jgi:pantetheine-phosphate adenylyltransferase, bacterial
MVCVYPGSFDPVTNGHLDIIYRAAKISERLIVAVGRNDDKKPMFTVEERIELLKISLQEQPLIEVSSFSGLLVDFLAKVGADTVIKGLRAVSDFEFEYQMALINKNLNPMIETLFLMTSANYSFLSSQAVRVIAKNGGSIDGLVPDCIKKRIYEKLGG